MIGIKRRSSIYYPIKEYYKRRIMVGDMLTNKTLYADFPDDFADKTDLNLNESERAFCIYNNSSPGSFDVRLLEYTDGVFEYGICVGPTALRNNIYFYNIETNKLEVNENKYKMSDKVQDVTEVTDCQAYRHIYIKDPNIRPLKVGDALKNGTKLYFNIPDNITELYSEYKHTSSTRSKVSTKTPILKASPSAPSTTDTLISKFLNVTYYPDDFELPLVTNLILTDGSSNIDIFKATLNQSINYKPEINISAHTITSPTTITDYNEFDFWSQFILVDETTL
jgi:hypothetical protein